MALHWDIGPTPESISQARHVMWEERAAAERHAPGLRIGTAGQPTTTVIACPRIGCDWNSPAMLNPRKALRSLCSHLVRVHAWRKDS
jgi:hypothetical protein